MAVRKLRLEQMSRVWMSVLISIASTALAQYQSPAALVGAGMCPKTPKAWLEWPLPLQELRLGGQKLDPEGIRQSLRTTSGLRAQLARELVAAKLNLAVGVESSAIVSSLAQAERWLKEGIREEPWIELLRDTLEAFNRSRYGVCR